MLKKSLTKTYAKLMKIFTRKVPEAVIHYVIRGFRIRCCWFFLCILPKNLFELIKSSTQAHKRVAFQATLMLLAVYQAEGSHTREREIA